MYPIVFFPVNAAGLTVAQALDDCIEENFWPYKIIFPISGRINPNSLTEFVNLDVGSKLFGIIDDLYL